MTKQELIKAVTQTVRTMDPQRSVTAVMVEAVLDALVDVTAAELLGGGEVTLPRLGKLVFITCKDLKEAMRS